jgi:hypothetical protein
MPIILSIINEENLSNDSRLSWWLLSTMWMHENHFECWKEIRKKTIGVYLNFWGES